MLHTISCICGNGATVLRLLWIERESVMQIDYKK